MSADLVPVTAVSTEGAAVAAYDPAAAVVLGLMERAAKEDEEDKKPPNTKRAYENDWALWKEFHAYLTAHNGVELPLSAVTRGTLVGFVNWLDMVKGASPNSIDRRITGVIVTARAEPYNAVISKEVTKAARRALKPFKADKERLRRGRGKAPAATPAHLALLNQASASSDLGALRDRAARLMQFGIAGRSAEVSALDAGMVKLEDKGLRVHVPGVKGKEARDVVVSYSRNPQVCPVRTWLAWREAAELTDDDPAFMPVTQHGTVIRKRLQPGGVQAAITRARDSAGVGVHLTSHSMRAGFITTAIAAGRRPDRVRDQSGHSPNSEAFLGYIREGDAWNDAASEGLM